MAGLTSLERLDPRAVEDASPRGAGSLGPWTSEQLLRVVGGNAVAAAVMAASWFQLSGEITVRGQLTWLNVGFVGLGIAGASNAVWLLRGRTSVGRARMTLLPNRTRRAHSTTTGGPSRLVTAHGMTKFHRPECPFARDRDTHAATRSQYAALGLLPCEVCLPESLEELAS